MARTNRGTQEADDIADRGWLNQRPNTREMKQVVKRLSHRILSLESATNPEGADDE